MAKKPQGRKSSYTDALARVILDRLAGGESLRAICRDPKIAVSEATVRAWSRGLNGSDETFPAQYAQARDDGHRVWFDEMIEIADEAGALESGHQVQAARLQVDTRKWALSKMLPREFGDRIDVNQSGDVSIRVVTGIAASPGSKVRINE